MFVVRKPAGSAALAAYARGVSQTRFGVAPDSFIPDITSGWEFKELKDTTLFFRNVGAILSQGSVLVLEEGSMARDVRSFVEQHAVSPVGRLRAGTIWPRGRWHWVPNTSEVLDRLAALSKQHAEPEICDHLYAVSEGELTVAWHDAFDGPLLVSSVVSETQVKEFAQGVGVEPTQWNAG